MPERRDRGDRGTGGPGDRARGGSRRARRALVLALCAAPAAGCTTLDNAVGAVPWFTTMRDQVATRPFEALPGDSVPRTAPAGSVPVTGIEDSLDLYTKDLREIRNPVPRDSASLERGRRTFLTYCAVCHGPAGNGDGTVAGKFGYVPPLTQDLTKQRSDGYIYAILRHGRGIMPRYGERIRGADRWHVVNYVRRLQGL